MSRDRTGADLFVAALESYGVTRVFGNPGTTELPVSRAIGESGIEYVLGLHEGVAVGAATGYARTRRHLAHADDSILPLGVANLHVAPGLAHGLGGLIEAWYARAPVLVTAGTHGLAHRHEDPPLAGDLRGMVDPYTKFAAEATDPAALPGLLRRAIRAALSPPTGPTFLALPLDVMLEPIEAGVEPDRLGQLPTSGPGDAAAIDRAADALAEATEPVLVVGDGVGRRGADAVEAAVDLAEAGGLRVHAEILAAEADFPTTHDQWVSVLPPDADLTGALLSTDAICFVGCGPNTTLTAHEYPIVDPETTCVHVGPDVSASGTNYPVDVAVVGDPATSMNALAEALAGRLDESTRADRIDRIGSVQSIVSARLEQMTGDEASAGGDAHGTDRGVSKPELAEALRAVAPEALLVDEGVTARYALLTRWELAPDSYLAGKSGGLGFGAPGAVGAAIAEAERAAPRDVLGFVGDGSFLYYPQALYTAAREGVDLTLVVANNRNYRILKDNAEALLDAGDGAELPGLDIDPAVDLVAAAESVGAAARRAETPAEVEAAVADAMGEDGPSLVDVLVRD